MSNPTQNRRITSSVLSTHARALLVTSGNTTFVPLYCPNS